MNHLLPPDDTVRVTFKSKTEVSGLTVGPVWFVVPDRDEYLHIPAAEGRYWYSHDAEKLAALYSLEFDAS